MRVVGFLLVVASSMAILGVAPEEVKVRQTDVPPGLFVEGSDTVAYVAEGDSRHRYQEVFVPLGPLARPRGEAGAEYLLLAHSNGRYWAIPHQRRTDALVAQVSPGLTYVIARQLGDA